MEKYLPQLVQHVLVFSIVPLVFLFFKEFSVLEGEILRALAVYKRAR